MALRRRDAPVVDQTTGGLLAPDETADAGDGVTGAPTTDSGATTGPETDTSSPGTVTGSPATTGSGSSTLRLPDRPRRERDRRDAAERAAAPPHRARNSPVR